VLLDVRWRLGGPPGREAYRSGHLPGASFIDLERELAAEPGPGGRHPMPEAGSFEAAMRRAGVRENRLVVVYDEADATAAARCWWLLRYFGHRHVCVLDGGYRAWVSAGGRLVPGEELPPGPGDFTARPGHMPLLNAGAAADLARLGALLDARAPERYRGDMEPVDPVAGHIPGAVSAPATGNVTPEGRFLPAGVLRARFAAFGAGERRDPPVGSYCGSGVTATQEVLALAIAGIPAALYVGSWSHWITDPARPVATGPEPGGERA
jgi:thiosulfate/3-mercaptopyruvate sulfurtransferase